MNIAQNLRKLMESRNLSSSRLAREIHVHTSTVSNWLDGKDVKAENLEALCKYFECTLDYLAGTTKKAPIQQDRRLGEEEMKAAFFGGYSDELTKDEVDELWDDAKDYLRYKIEQKKKRRE